MIIRKFWGWDEASFNDYKNCYFQYGGNFSSHPDVLSYIHSNADCTEKYFVHRTAGAVDGAVCVWNKNKLANDISSDLVTSHLSIPVSKDELILPLTKERNIIVPFKSKIVSPINKNIINRSELFNSRRAICLAKPLESFSNKTVKNRKRELSKFLNDGGEIKDQSEFSADEMFDIYNSLFEMRRGKQHHDKRNALEFIKTFRSNFFGKILFLNNAPCAFMMITNCDSKNIISLDFINIGINKEIKKHSLGSILMWVNINEAYKSIASEDKKIRFSFGRPTADYKKMWCFQEKLGRLV
ncbi:Mig-14 family protein [Buttiauxella warmboldiae]|uniref:Mig-14 family protein n=1 Tax=Buttiauxella warmboldiae TaxID=82993 RepID=A0A3N5E935_9ENTR|nr:Mig-14 family protein [Buttiauxella warmboldiae]RPH26732.1 Mig-14 family protein [Buttiauxella warmboldiae]